MEPQPAVAVTIRTIEKAARYHFPGTGKEVEVFSHRRDETESVDDPR